MKSAAAEEFENILKEEDITLTAMLKYQADMKKAVIEKNWESLTASVDKINALSESFVSIDGERDLIQDVLKSEEIINFKPKLNELRQGLLKFKIQNEALNKYVNITRDFVQGVIENAIPQRTSKVYSRTGIVQKQPMSVVLNQLF